jgi:hypothetical protein
MEDKRDQASKAADRLRVALADTEIMLKAIEGARMQLSSTSDELMSRVEEISHRVHTHRLELDKITRLLKHT